MNIRFKQSKATAAIVIFEVFCIMWAVCVFEGIAQAAMKIEASKTVTAGQIVERIKQHVTCEWSQETVDTFKFCDPNTEVTGIATTMFATMDVLRRAHEAGLNFVITHEPTYYNHTDDIRELEGDDVVAAKRKYIAEHGLIVWRFHDHIHRSEPDGIVEGMIDKLGWRKYQLKNKTSVVFAMPEITVRELAADFAEKFGAASIRVVGDPDMKFTGAGLSVGASGSAAHMKLLRRNDVEVLVAGEAREWETVEYARDAYLQERDKALILIGHLNSEEVGMEYCAQWLKTFISEVPVEFIEAGDPFWSP